jgi:hypothetical protein
VHDADGDVRGPGARPLRIRVKDALDLLAAGASREEILADHPYLEPDDRIVVLQLTASRSDPPVLRSARCASWSMCNCRPHWPGSSSARGPCDWRPRSRLRTCRRSRHPFSIDRPAERSRIRKSAGTNTASP